MRNNLKKYAITLPLGLILTIIYVGISLWIPFFEIYLTWIIIFFAIFPMVALGEYLDKHVFGIKSGMSKQQNQHKPSLADTQPMNYVKCTNCGKSVRRESQFCDYCAKPM